MNAVSRPLHPSHPKVSVCGDCPAFARCVGHALPVHATAAVAELAATARLVQRNEHVYRAGESMRALYVVKAGCIKTYIDTEAGDERVLGFYLPGDIIGFDGIAQGVHPNSAEAVDTGAVCELPLGLVEKAAVAYPALHAALMQWCGAELARTQRFVQTVATRSADARMANFLLDLSDYFATRGYSPVRFTLPMLRSDIGRHLGLAAETVSRVVHRLRSADIVDIRRQQVEILDVHALATMASRELPEALLAAHEVNATTAPARSCARGSRASRRPASTRAAGNAHMHP